VTQQPSLRTAAPETVWVLLCGHPGGKSFGGQFCITPRYRNRTPHLRANGRPLTAVRAAAGFNEDAATAVALVARAVVGWRHPHSASESDRSPAGRRMLLQTTTAAETKHAAAPGMPRCQAEILSWISAHTAMANIPIL